MQIAIHFDRLKTVYLKSAIELLFSSGILFNRRYP